MEGEIHSATSTDLKHWQDTGVALAASDQNPWETGRMLAGCALKENGTYYLFYSAAGPGAEFLNEGIGLATSTDGVHWQRYLTTELIKPSAQNPWYSRFKRPLGGYEYDYFPWRDPYVVRDVETGRYYIYICASAKAASSSSIYRGCIGLAIADEITGPYELQPPVALPLVPDTQESAFYEMERPQIIYKQGRYHLFFSCWLTKLNPKCLPTVEQRQITDSTLYWYVSDHPTDPLSQQVLRPLSQAVITPVFMAPTFFPRPIAPMTL
ncbi:beta-fructosidase [filamentous cyanobacterium CCT1]|nr:beta-fructosidase [filamentous cyanobacterium CCT1]PSN81613.1 beta-fructosidase [filamentous cyanobacterium CCP4]